MKLPARKWLLLITVLWLVAAAFIIWWFDDGKALKEELAKVKSAKTRADVQRIMGGISWVFGADDPEQGLGHTDEGPIAKEDYPLGGTGFDYDDGKVMVIWDRHGKVRNAWMNRYPWHERLMRWVRAKTGW